MDFFQRDQLTRLAIPSFEDLHSMVYVQPLIKPIIIEPLLFRDAEIVSRTVAYVPSPNCSRSQ